MVFLAGCNFACPYCQNARLIPLDSGIVTDTYTVEQLLTKGRKLLDAAGFSGGEPTLQPEAVTHLAERAKSHSLQVFLNTNGSQPDVLRRLLDKELLDDVAIDVKAPLKVGKYGPVIGHPDEDNRIITSIRRSIQECLDAGASLELRTTVVPGLNGSMRDIQEIVSCLPISNYRYVLQQFVPSQDVLDSSLTNAKSHSHESLLSLAQCAVRLGIKDVWVRTREYGMEKVES